MPDPNSRLASALADRYRIERELGAGGMATVWLAEDLKHHRKVAIKVLRPELASAVGGDRFLAEIRIIANLQHPHILGLIDSGALTTHDSRLLYYVMPYVDGESLRARLTRETQLSIDDAVRIASEVGNALDYAHRHGVIHRDIKPENILLQDGGALVADFGIALALTGAAGARLTETGTSIGTPQYMSPEQAMGGRDLDARSDIYSLGVVLYEMLAGEPPFSGPTSQAVIAKLLTERPTQLRVVRSSVPPAVDAAVARALEKVPADRFPAATHFVRALHHAPTISRASGAHVRRWGAALTGAVLVVAAGSWWLRSREAHQAVPAPNTTQLTFTGNADLPALSPDGSRVAYVAQECSAGGACSSTIMIGDTTGSATLALVRGRGPIDDLEWTRDGRFLLYEEVHGNRLMAFAVSTLGGTPRPLGPGGSAMLDGSDTALVENFGTAGDSPLWLRVVTIADGVTHDSILMPGHDGYWFTFGSPDTRRIGVGSISQNDWTIRIIDRSGRQLDSMSHAHGAYFTIRWAPSGDALLATSSRPDAPATFDLLRFPVSRTGMIGRAPDTLLRQVPMSAGHVQVGEHGGLTYANETQERVLYALARQGGGGFRFSTRRIAAATGSLVADLNPAGTRILLRQVVGVGGAKALSTMSFDSGPVLMVGTPMTDLEDASWADGGERVLLARRRGDRIVLSEVDPATGTSRETGTLTAPTGAEVLVAAVPGGGALVSVRQPTGCRIYPFRTPGKPDNPIALPPTFGCMPLPSPDGTAGLGAVLNEDSPRLAVVSLAEGQTTARGALGESTIGPIKWLANGSILLARHETLAMTELFSMSDPDAPLRSLGTLPVGGGYYSFSADGHRIVASVREPRHDVYLVNSYKDLLRRKH